MSMVNQDYSASWHYMIGYLQRLSEGGMDIPHDEFCDALDEAIRFGALDPGEADFSEFGAAVA